MRGLARGGIAATCCCVCNSCQPCRQCCPLCCCTQKRLQRVQERGVCDVARVAEGFHIGHERWGAGAQAGCQRFTGRFRVEENIRPILHSMQLGTDNHSRFTPWRELMDTKQCKSESTPRQCMITYSSSEAVVGSNSDDSSCFYMLNWLIPAFNGEMSQKPALSRAMRTSITSRDWRATTASEKHFFVSEQSGVSCER
jgi:hypothetical protein